MRSRYVIVIYIFIYNAELIKFVCKAESKVSVGIFHLYLDGGLQLDAYGVVSVNLVVGGEDCAALVHDFPRRVVEPLEQLFGERQLPGFVGKRIAHTDAVAEVHLGVVFVIADALVAEGRLVAEAVGYRPVAELLGERQVEVQPMLVFVVVLRIVAVDEGIAGAQLEFQTVGFQLAAEERLRQPQRCLRLGESGAHLLESQLLADEYLGAFDYCTCIFCLPFGAKVIVLCLKEPSRHQKNEQYHQP